MDTVRTNSPIVISDGPLAIDARGKVFLPFVVNERPPIHNYAEQFFSLLWNDKRQLRPSLSLYPNLILAATWRATTLRDGPISHTDQWGVTPNEYARNAGCKLPDLYAKKGNQIESFVIGSSDMEVMFNALANSPAHADHMFGRVDMFRKQDKCGIAVAEGGKYGWYLILLISECLE